MLIYYILKFQLLCWIFVLFGWLNFVVRLWVIYIFFQQMFGWEWTINNARFLFYLDGWFFLYSCRSHIYIFDNFLDESRQIFFQLNCGPIIFQNFKCNHSIMLDFCFIWEAEFCCTVVGHIYQVSVSSNNTLEQPGVVGHKSTYFLHIFTVFYEDSLQMFR